MSALGKARKIGMFGGTFDPVHKGHLAVAKGVLDRYGLDEVLFIPAPRPPHKGNPQTDFYHRVAMLEAVLVNEPKMSISMIEAERLTPSYTFDTLVELRKRVGDHRYHLIVGADSFIEIHLWYRYQELCTLTDMIIAARPGIELVRVAEQVSRLPGRFVYDAEEQVWTRDDGFRIKLYQLTSTLCGIPLMS